MPNHDAAAQAFLQEFTFYVRERLVRGAELVQPERKRKMIESLERLVKTFGGDQKHAERLMSDMRTMAEGGSPTFPPP